MALSNSTFVTLTVNLEPQGCAGKDNECDGRYFFKQEGNSLDLNRASPNNRPGTATNTVRPEQRFAVLICVLVLVSSLGFHWRGHGTHADARLPAKKDFPYGSQ
ncbi:hypothetical protein B0H13DRAFT_1852464 [Mycena leptocephala]|nr:hypothetical protein B0H13DRAFT_1852464 [Mycena leptocephala]